MRNAFFLSMLSLVPLVAEAAPRAPAPVHEALPFIEDDYPRALAEARQKKLPLFVDSWAPWCHTCRFMRAYVFTDESLRKQAGRFVWLSIDTENPKNAAFLAKYPIEVWPTLMVIDPEREEAALRWPGSLNPQQLVKLLDDGERAVRGSGEGGLVALAGADRLASEGHRREAAAVYRVVLPSVPAEKRPRVVESLLAALALSGDAAGCAQAALELAPTMPRGPSFANAMSFALGCTAELKGAEGEHARKVLVPLGEEALRLPGLLADDRSGLYEELVQLRQQAGDAAGAKELAGRWLTFLEAEAARAPTPEQRAAFDPHRVNAALALGEPLRAEAALKASERDLPRDYNPAARLAIIYDAAGRTGDALAAIGRALRKVYGPRALRLYDFEAGLQLKKGDKAAARATLRKALTVANALPASAPGKAARIASLQQRLASIH